MKKNFWNLSIGLLANLVTRVLETSGKAAYAKLVEGLAFLQKLIEANVAYHEVVDKPAYSGHGKAVAEADLLRDNRFIGFKNVVLGFTQMGGITNHQDAVDLFAIINLHGADLYHYTYDEESTHLTQLIQDLEKPGNTTRLHNLNLTEAFTLLKASQVAFSLLVSDQSEANSQLRGMESASSLNKNLITALSNYVNYVDAMSTIDSGWSGLALELNEVLKPSNTPKQAPKKETATPVETK
jgi:hypothetical protein